MAIKKPGKELLVKVPLKFVRNRVAGGGRKSADASIILVPFIDFLVVLVVFLLSSFSATGELLAQDPSLKMPDAEHVVDLEVAPVIAINPDVVTLDGLQVATTKDLVTATELKVIDQLVENLETLKRNWETLHPNEPFHGTVIFQADRGTDFKAMKQIMASTAKAGYANVSFAVNNRAKK